MIAPRYAALGPHAAVYVLAALRRAGVSSAKVRADVLWRRTHGYGIEADELDAGWRQLVAAENAYLESSRPVPTGPGSVIGSGAGTVPAEPAPVEGVSEWIGTHEAAALLGVTDRRVRELLRCGGLSGRRSSPRGSWSVERASVEELAMMRKAKSA